MLPTMEKAHKMFIRPNFPEHAKATLAVMWEDSKKGLFYDVTLISGLDGKKFAAHRSVLSAVNDFFRTMFSSDFKEAGEKDITLADISADILEALIAYCYTGIIDINEDNVQLLLPQSQLMLFPEIVEACSDFLQSLINTTNCQCLFQYAKLYNCDTLRKGVEEYMQENFLNIVITQEFLQWNDDEVKEYLSNDKMNVNNEKEVFEALMRWIDHDQDSRKSSLSKLLPLIRLHYIDTKFLLEYILNKSSNDYFMTLVDETKQHLFNAPAMPERIKSKTRLVIVYQEKIAIFNPLTSIIELEYTFDSNAYTSTILGEKVILVGMDKLRSFDLTTESWVNLTATQTCRNYHAVEVLNGCIYVLGGLEENTVERWDAKINKWNYIASMVHKRAGPCTAVHKGKLYVMGGKSSNEFLNSVECYDPYTNQWSFCSSMLEKKAYAKAVVLNGEIYVFGGYANQSLSSIEKYNLETDTWTIVSKMTTERHFLGACLFGKKVILFGGGDGKNECVMTMEEYDLNTNECKLLPATFPKYKFKVDMFSYSFPNKIT